MSRNVGLVHELATRGVEVKTLGDTGKFIRGNGLPKSELTDQGTRAIHYGQIHTIYGTTTDTTTSFTDPAAAIRLRKAEPGDLIIATTSEDDKSVAKATAWLGKGEVVISGDACIYHHDFDPRFIAYFFQSELFQGQKRRYISGTKVRRISRESLSKIKVPVPPIEVQQMIGLSLERLEGLEAELEAALDAELAKRRQQHAYYRDSLLNFPEGGEVARVPLADLAHVGTGSRNTNEASLGAPYPFFVRSQEPLTIDEYEFDEQAIITAGDGVGVGKVFHFANGKYGLHQRAYRIRVTSDDLLPKFLFHYIRNDFRRYLAMISVHASVTSLRKPMFQKYPVPVPPLAEQERIVTILDNLEGLVHSLSVELSTEVNTRRRQYEYYRDKLLTFRGQWRE